MWTSTIKSCWREVDPTATDERFYKRTERKGGCTGGKTSNCWMEMIQQRTGLFNHKRVNRKEAVKCSTGWSHHLTPPWWFTWWLSPYQNWTDFVCMENVLYGFKTAPGWGLMMICVATRCGTMRCGGHESVEMKIVVYYSFALLFLHFFIFIFHLPFSYWIGYNQVQVFYCKVLAGPRNPHAHGFSQTGCWQTQTANRIVQKRCTT